MGSCIADVNPARTMIMDNTDAKIGRVMKNLVMMILVTFSRRGWSAQVAAHDSRLQNGATQECQNEAL